ncbi:response regulator [Ktedonobacter racemifer]|uniref:Response regulator receiver protein n=1 Tax=Ktedonobacter racemifer DSM 44963 TaxID=485913 RepID=D6TH51_KTERA|nr:response regulator [Ktedonobacter racemifer]EFH90793.1 response regulator receiver protein [Ktedonobacter racemifer DSM 44963]
MGKKILVVNDTQSILEMFRELLEPEGYEVVLSSFPIQNIKEVEQIKPDLIILDIVFGNQKSGWQMLQLLKMYPPTSKTPIIVCSAAISEVRDQEGYLVSQGVQALYKPFDVSLLFHLVEQAFKTSEASMQKKKQS